MEQPQTGKGERLFPWIIFCACIALYTARAIAFHSDFLTLDEQRYLGCARNLCQGYLVTDDNPDFVNGPGYPLVLAPFLKLNLSLFWARWINGVWLGMGCVFLYATVRFYANRWWALIAALWVMLQPSVLRLGPFLMSESFMMLCAGVFVWAFCKALRAEDRVVPQCLLAAVALWAMIMTRVMFGHVATASLILALAAWPFLKAWRGLFARTAAIMGLALILCLPYLAYTKAKTGKNWCWSTNSGELLYWITSAHPGENGFWYSPEDAKTLPELAPNHRKFFEDVMKLPVLQREEAFTEKAMENLRNAPFRRLAANWVSNLSRMAFGFPRSFMDEELSRSAMVIWNGPFLLLLGSTLALVVIRPGSIPGELVVLLVISLVYLGGSTLPPALLRYAMVVNPLLWVVIAASLSRNLHIHLAPFPKT